ncbi:MAG: hypothetical protein ACI9DC_003080 [Gammaproteobacteria bacterium]
MATFAPFDPRSSEPKTRPRKKAQNSDTSERLARTRTAQWYAQFYAQHGEHPSHIDEVGEHAAEFQPAPEASDRATDITYRQFPRCHDADPQYKRCHYRRDHADRCKRRTRSLSWECHASDCKSIQINFPQCRYRETSR